MQFALQAIHFLFIFFENIFGLMSLKVLARYQIARFHYKQFDGVNEKNDDLKEFDWLYNLDQNNKRNRGYSDLKKEF